MLHIIKVILLFFFLLISSADSIPSNLTELPEQEIKLSEIFPAKVKYSYPTPTRIRFTLIYGTVGFMGFGFGIKEDADIVVCNFKKGVPQIRDYNSPGLGILIDEPQQDWQLISAERKDGVTTFVIERELDTHDPKDHVIYVGKPLRAVWSYGVSDKIGYHFEHRGSVEEFIL